jgi:hypothetical protein
MVDLSYDVKELSYIKYESALLGNGNAIVRYSIHANLQTDKRIIPPDIIVYAVSKNLGQLLSDWLEGKVAERQEFSIKEKIGEVRKLTIDEQLIDKISVTNLFNSNIDYFEDPDQELLIIASFYEERKTGDIIINIITSVAGKNLFVKKNTYRLDLQKVY